MTKPPTLADPAGAPSVIEAAKRDAVLYATWLACEIGSAEQKRCADILIFHRMKYGGDVARALIKAHEALEKAGRTPSLEQTVEAFADAADYNLTCWDAYGDGPVPAGVTRLYELGQEARRLLKPIAALTNPASEDTAKD